MGRSQGLGNCGGRVATPSPAPVAKQGVWLSEHLAQELDEGPLSPAADTNLWHKSKGISQVGSGPMSKDSGEEALPL